MNIVPFDQFIADSKTGQLPNLSFVVPNLVHDAHNGSLKVADAWLRLHIKPIFETPAFQPGGDGLLVIVFDDRWECQAAGAKEGLLRRWKIGCDSKGAVDAAPLASKLDSYCFVAILVYLSEPGVLVRTVRETSFAKLFPHPEA